MGALNKMSLRKSFMLIMVLFLLAAILTSVLFVGLCDVVLDQCNLRGTVSTEDANLPNQNTVIQIENGELVVAYGYYTVEPYYTILNVMKIVVPIGIFIVALIWADVFFYKVKLKKPLEILSYGAEQIRQQNLDFEITPCSKDELGELCSAFDVMRQALLSNNRALWRKVEERKRLNAAFAHDLRTPLTVLKGQSEMLIKYAPQMSDTKVISTAEMMGRHITRLENYVSTMNEIQRLEDIEVQKQNTAVVEIVKQMELTGTSVCAGIEFTFEDRTGCDTVCVDISVLMQAYENLLSNAVRFSHGKVSASLALANDMLVLTVTDNGNGFTPKDLSDAANPFYKTGNETNHFGMGLHICKLLCEKYGGLLELTNDNGAKVVATFGQSIE